jgi:predicted nucleotidyltransferase
MELENFQFIDKIKKLPFVEAIWLFGSRARGDSRSTSDIDLAIVCPNASTADSNRPS